MMCHTQPQDSHCQMSYFVFQLLHVLFTTSTFVFHPDFAPCHKPVVGLAPSLLLYDDNQKPMKSFSWSRTVRGTCFHVCFDFISSKFVYIQKFCF